MSLPTASDTRAATGATTRRSYDSTRRRRQAEQTRTDVLMAAGALFNEMGWAGTTMAAIADAAGVAVETVYSGFKSKKALLLDAADAAVVGDAEPVAFVDRPEFAAFGVGPVADRLRAGMDVIADTNERTAGIWRAVSEAAESDDELREWALDAERRRREDTGAGLEAIFGHPVDGAVLDALCILYGQDSYQRLVVERGYSRAEYQRLMAEVTVRLLGEDLGLVDAIG